MLKVLTKGCEPTRGSKFSAGIDLYASEDVVIGAGETAIVGLGVCIDNDFIVSNIEDLQDEEYNTIEYYSDGNWVDFFKMSHYLELHPRSSLRAKGLISGVGVIDLDYEQEIKIIIHNPIRTESIVNTMRVHQYKEELDDFNFDYKINKGDKIAQILLKEHKGYLFGVESDEERTGGFGSTGK